MVGGIMNVRMYNIEIVLSSLLDETRRMLESVIKHVCMRANDGRDRHQKPFHCHFHHVEVRNMDTSEACTLNLH